MTRAVVASRPRCGDAGRAGAADAAASCGAPRWAGERVARLVLGDHHVVFLDALSTVLSQHGYVVSAVARSCPGDGRPRAPGTARRMPDRPARPLDDDAQTIGRLRAASERTSVVVLSAARPRGRRPGAGCGRIRLPAPVARDRRARVRARARAARRGRGRRPGGSRRRGARPSRTRRCASPRHLTSRERQCLLMLVEGLDTAAMVERLGVSRTTVRTHLQAVLTKLGVHSRLEAASFAVRHRLPDLWSAGKASRPPRRAARPRSRSRAAARRSTVRPIRPRQVARPGPGSRRTSAWRYRWSRRERQAEPAGARRGRGRPDRRTPGVTPESGPSGHTRPGVSLGRATGRPRMCRLGRLWSGLWYIDRGQGSPDRAERVRRLRSRRTARQAWVIIVSISGVLFAQGEQAGRHEERTRRGRGPGGRERADGAAAGRRADAAGRRGPGLGVRPPASAPAAAAVYGSRVVVLAGSGDNGGDALYAGARLAARGAVVTAVAAADRMHEGGAAALRGAGGRLIEAADQAADAHGDRRGRPGHRRAARHRRPRRPAGARPRRWPRRRAARRALVVAVDLPSGIDADTGEAAGAAVRADVTVTFGTLKPGLLIDPGASHAGVVELVDIGLRRYLGPPDVAAPQAADIAAWLPRPSAESDKYRRGVLGIVAGQRPVHRRPDAGRRRRHPRRRRAWSGWCRPRSRWAWSGSTGPRRSSPPRTPARRAARPSRRPARSRPGPPGRAWAPTRPPPACSRRSWRPTSRCWSTPTGSPCWPLTASCCRARRPPCSRRTPASSPGCSARTGPTWKPTASGSPPGPPPSSAAPCCSRARPR